MRTIEEIVKCLKLCCNDASCSTESHQCFYGDESMIDCVDRLNGDYERIMQAVSKINSIERLEEICNAERECSHTPSHANSRDSRPKNATLKSEILQLQICIRESSENLERNNFFLQQITEKASEMLAENATLKKALELMYQDNKGYNHGGMGNPAYYIQEARDDNARQNNL